MADTGETFGETIKRHRRELVLTQRQVAEKLGIDVTYLSKLENGRGEAPSEKLVRELASELKADPEELLALAGRVPSEIRELAQGDVEFARFLRRLPEMDEAQRKKLYRQANPRRGKP
jgi:HTH-type transcriptional regulator, competence development regulator